MRTTCPLHVQTQLLDWTPRCFNTAERLCDNVCYTRNQLLYIKPARLTPDIIGHLRRLGIGSNLPRKRICRGGSRKQKKIAVLDCDNRRRPSSTACKQQAHEYGTVNFNNLITVPLLPSDQQNKCKSLIIAQFNPRSVGQVEKRTAINDFFFSFFFWTTMLT
ncbi:hypothetical protein, partial [Thiolapillus sp.]|uniref:hypothetical protein n=1 Tax=Thiolapillus sp. TaxID=2017437 RepID=UPI003AF9FB18